MGNETKEITEEIKVSPVANMVKVEDLEKVGDRSKRYIHYNYETGKTFGLSPRERDFFELYKQTDGNIKEIAKVLTSRYRRRVYEATLCRWLKKGKIISKIKTEMINTGIKNNWTYEKWYRCMIEAVSGANKEIRFEDGQVVKLKRDTMLRLKIMGEAFGYDKIGGGIGSINAENVQINFLQGNGER